MTGEAGDKRSFDDAAYIAAVSPDVVLGLIARLEEVSEQVRRVLVLHKRRRHQAMDTGFITPGHTEFPDQCGMCRVPWPCWTARAIELVGPVL